MRGCGDIFPEIFSVFCSTFRLAIRDQIKSADMVVIITSESSVESQWVNYEAGMADALGKPIVVVGRRGIGKSSLLTNLADAKVIEIEDTG